MKVYMVLTKRFYTFKGIEHQVADALEPITTYSSYAKANKEFIELVNWYKNRLGYEGDEPKHRNLFPVEHCSLKKILKDGTIYRTVIYIIKSEVE